MENFLKNRFSEIQELEEGLSYYLYRGFDKLFQKNVIVKVLFPIATKEISLLTSIAQLHHRNLISPIDIVPLPEGYYCLIFQEYPREKISKNVLKSDEHFSFSFQIQATIEFLLSKKIGIRNLSWKNISKDNEIFYLTELEENIYKILSETEEEVLKELSRLVKVDFSSREIFLNNKNPHLISSLIGFDLRRKEDQILDGFLDEKGFSITKVLGIFGSEGNGKSVFLRNFIIRNRSLSSPMVFISSSGKEEFLKSLSTQISWLDTEKEFKVSDFERAENSAKIVETLFKKNEYDSILFIFDDLDKADYEVVEFFEKFANSIDYSLPVKFIFTSEAYFPFLKDFRSFHLNLSFSSFEEFRQNLWLGVDELDDYVEIAWRKSRGNLNLFHWITKDPEFWKEGETYKEKGYVKKDLLKNLKKEEIEILNLISCFPKGFDFSWIGNFSEVNVDFNTFLNKEIIERKGTRLFIKEPWHSIFQENLSEGERKKIHEVGAYFDRENSYYHLFMAGKYEEGLKELLEFLENLRDKGQILEGIDLGRNYEKFINNIIDSEKKFRFFSLISELYLKIGDFENAFQYVVKSSHFVNPSSEEWMEIKLKIAECLYGMMKYKKAIEVLTESAKFAKIYNYERYLNAFNYYLSKNLWKIGKYEEAEVLLKDLEKNGDDLFSGIAMRDRGYHEFLRGEISKGKELLESSLKILEKFPGEKAISLKYLACVLMKEKNWKESFNCFFKAMRILEKENDLFNLAGLCSDIGKLFLEKEDLLNAEVWFKKAFDLYSKIENPRGMILSQFNLTEVMIPMGKWETAKDILNECAQIDKSSQNILSYAYDMNSLGYIEFLTGNFDFAKRLLEESRDIFKNCNTAKELLDSENKLLELLIEINLLKKAKEIIDEIDRRDLSDDLIKETLNYKLLKAKYFLKKKEFSKAERLIDDVIENASMNEFKTILGNANLLKAEILKQKEDPESINHFISCLEIFSDVNNDFMRKVSLLEFFKNFPDKVEIKKAIDALNWLKDCGYFKCSQYEELLYPKEESSIKLLKLLSEMGRFEWIKVFSISEGKISLEAEFPPAESKENPFIDFSLMAPEVLKIGDYEILQIPVLKFGVLDLYNWERKELLKRM
jgi:hypothetical protein